MDLISRQAAIDAVSRGCYELRGVFAECEKNLNELPSVQSEPSQVARDIATIINNEKDMRVVLENSEPYEAAKRLSDLIIVNFKKTRDDAILPERKTSGSAGYDLYALLDEESILLLPGEKYKFRTGASMELPSGYCAFVSSRSSVSWNQNLEIIGGNGTIDDDYRGEIMVPLRNVGNDAQRVYNGQRIAQLVIQKYETVKFNEVKDLNKTERGAGSFGSTGR